MKYLSMTQKVAEICNEYFVNATDSLDIIQPKVPLQHIDGIHDPVELAIKKYSCHSSVTLAPANNKPSHTFTFNFFTNNGVSTILRELKVKKASPVESIPRKILRDNLGTFIYLLQQQFNASIDNGIFPTELKKCEVTCVFKANDQMIKSNYRPITVLPAVAKAYERLMTEQMTANTETFLSPYLCGFRKGYNTQHALVRVVEKCKSVLEKRIRRSNLDRPLQGV